MRSNTDPPAGDVSVPDGPVATARVRSAAKVNNREVGRLISGAEIVAVIWI